MAANMQKIKLLKLYELLRKETDETHPISRVELCRRLNEMGISSNVRTLSLGMKLSTQCIIYTVVKRVSRWKCIKRDFSSSLYVA